ncbi:MAG TPA: ferredoxin [Methanoregulaceae archaeon]|nr:ferredoxin [Methanoregulaceae archaeon]
MVSVTIEREMCVSCGSCYETCPDFFEENPEDSFSQVIEKFRKGDNISEGEVPPDQEACVRDAADLCPVSIIHVEE